MNRMNETPIRVMSRLEQAQRAAKLGGGYIQADVYDLDAVLAPGMPVIVRWGYGRGFAAEGRGVIEKVYPMSVRVRLTEDVPCGDRVGWPSGLVLMGVKRHRAYYTHVKWDCVLPLKPGKGWAA